MWFYLPINLIIIDPIYLMEIQMAWNEPGDGKDKDPWGKRDDGQGPPDLDEIIKNMNDKFGKIFGGKKGGGGFGGGNIHNIGGNKFNKLGLAAIAVIALMVWMFSGIFTVDQGKQAVVLQFGAYHRTTEAGLQWHLPLVQNYYIVDVSAIQSLTLGERETEALMLTEDENIVDIKMTIQFRIQNPEHFLFNVKEPATVLRQVTESAIREVIGKNKMDHIITGGRAEIAQKVHKLAQSILDRYKSGLVITNFVMQDAQPPEQVQDAFDDAVKAREDKQRFVNEAEAYQNQILPQARGQAAKQIAQAEAYEERVISEAQGDASRFLSVLKEYEKAPEVTRDRLYIDAMESVFGNSNKVLIDSKSNNNLMYLPLDKIISNSGAGRNPGGISRSETPLPDIVPPTVPSKNYDQGDQYSNRARSRDAARERR